MTMSLLRHNTVMGSGAYDHGRLAVTVQMWHAVVDCSRQGPQQTRKGRSTMVDNRVRQMTSNDDEVEHSRRCASKSAGSRRTYSKV